LSAEPPEQLIDNGEADTAVVTEYELEHTGAEYPDAVPVVSPFTNPVTPNVYDGTESPYVRDFASGETVSLDFRQSAPSMGITPLIEAVSPDMVIEADPTPSISTRLPAVVSTKIFAPTGSIQRAPPTSEPGSTAESVA
jgi:hypothetical protein